MYEIWGIFYINGYRYLARWLDNHWIIIRDSMTTLTPI
jgi:hypothetical protein